MAATILSRLRAVFLGWAELRTIGVRGFAGFYRGSIAIAGPGEGRTEGCYTGGGASARLEERVPRPCANGVGGPCDSKSAYPYL